MADESKGEAVGSGAVQAEAKDPRRDELRAAIGKAEAEVKDAKKEVAEWKKDYRESDEGSQERKDAFTLLSEANATLKEAITALKEANAHLAAYDKDKRQAARETQELNTKLRSLSLNYKTTHGESPFKKPLPFEQAIGEFKDIGLPIKVKYPHTLYDREQQLNAAFGLAESNFRQRSSTDHNQHTFVIVPGGSGIGKSRFGKEIAECVSRRGAEPGTFDETTVFTRYIHVDLNNGERYDQNFDNSSLNRADLQLGVRLASVSVIHRAFLDVIGRPKSQWASFTVSNVLEHLLRSDARLQQDKDSVLAIIIHIDEFQLFCDASANGHKMFKEMIYCLGHFMRRGMQKTEFAGRVFVVPVLTGTSPTDIRFLQTHKYKEATILLSPLSEASALKMFDDKFGKHPAHEAIRKSSHFRVAIHDTGFVPRLLHHMLDVANVALDTDWGTILSSFYIPEQGSDVLKRSLNLDTFGGASGAAAVMQFVLTAQPVIRDFVLPGGMTVDQLERTGVVVLLSRAGANDFVLMMPFVQLRAINQLLAGSSANIFANELLFSPTLSRPWRWQDFEELHAEFQAARINSLVAARRARLEAMAIDVERYKREGATAKGNDINAALARMRQAERGLAVLQEEAKTGFSVSEIVPGAVGLAATLQRRVILPEGTVRRYHESKQMLHLIKDTPDLVLEIDCNEGRHSVLDGVFLCADGNALFDGRFACQAVEMVGQANKPVLFLWQDKHSLVNTEGTVSADAIESWYQSARVAVGRVPESKFDVVFCFLTNRLLVGNVPEHYDLLVITRAQLRTYMGQTLAGRGTVPHNTGRD